MSRTAARKRHEATRARVRDLILELLAEKPMGPKKLIEQVLEQIPDATFDDVKAVRTNLRAKTGQIEMRGTKLCLTGTDRTKPITRLEHEAVAALATPKTARELTESCALIRNAFVARSVLSALASREIVTQIPNTDPAAYVANPEQLVEEVAA